MRIYIKQNNGKKIDIFIPNFLLNTAINIFNATIFFGKPWLHKEFKETIDCIDLRALKKCFKELRKYKGLKLVSVRSQNGEEVEIIV
ncbi:hypothetical protein [Thermobrachium celere]|uniref:Uncharacterized protein n=2 Tax=Thermobrachium TaxID=150333 RepID=R7RSP0_9CLOT|nr:hypothetical protein [Thermobrachium celere]GFR35517.1 hypothetical protein TCEA9_13290 [Thermobrachium celere]CDF59217.1 hypothetical protein TCEL_02285 [Thermobrachium celere DSM 8682]